MGGGPVQIGGADNALVQHSARDELNQTHITIQNLASQGQDQDLTV